MRSARCCGLSAALSFGVDRFAVVFVRFFLVVAGVGARFGVLPANAVLAAAFRFVDLLDSDLDAVLILLVSIRADMPTPTLGANFRRSPAER